MDLSPTAFESAAAIATFAAITFCFLAEIYFGRPPMRKVRK